MGQAGLLDMIMRLRSGGVSDNAVLRVMELIPRSHFVAPDLQSQAYDAHALPILCGQTLSAPMSIGLMTQMLDVQKSHTLLEIGMGSGYHTALLASLAGQVYSVERYKLLIMEAENRLQSLNIDNVSTRHGDGRYGWTAAGPFDRILVTCGLLAEPDTLLDQLSTDGICVAVIDGQLTRFKKARKRITEDAFFPLDIPMIEAGKSKVL